MEGLMSGNNNLNIFLGSEKIATLFLQSDNLCWEYTKNWQVKGFAVSPHLPLNKKILSLNVQRFLRNMLPEGNAFDELLACFNLSRNNTLGLVRALGLDTPGALIAIPNGEKYPTTAKFRKLSSKELTKRLNDRENFSLIIWDNKPRLSIAGVQDKINVVVNAKMEVGFGEGLMCSTHILKFEKLKTPSLVLNEYISMQLARACGLEVADVELKYFDRHPALLVQRFDRKLNTNGQVKRKHLIDGCQALNLPPEYKYERNFGSGRDVAHIREGVSLPKLFEFTGNCINPALTRKKIIEWVLFNILIYNSDAHGKNISFFVSASGISLAPFYDLINIKLYPQFNHDLAMGIGDEFDANGINAYQLADFADSCNISRTLITNILKTMIHKCQSSLKYDFENLANDNYEKQFITKYKKIVNKRCEHLLRQIDEIKSMEI